MTVRGTYVCDYLHVTLVTAFNVEISHCTYCFLLVYPFNDRPNRIAPISDINTVLFMSHCQDLQAPACQLTVYYHKKSTTCVDKQAALSDYIVT